MLKKLLILILIFISISGVGQKYYFDVYGVKQGLSNSDVYVIAQDRRGYVWLGTKSGISRFDGSSFKNFFSEEGAAPNGMRCMYMDSTGGMWFGHIGGGITYYHKGTFTNRTIDSVQSDVTSIVEDRHHHLWISTYGDGVFRIDNPYEEKYKIEHFAGAEGLSDRVSNIVITKDFGVMFVTDFGVKYYDEQSGKFEFIKNRISKWPEYFPVICMLEDSKQNLWVGTYNGGLYKFSEQGKKLKVYDHRDGLAKNWISYLYETREHEIWVGTWGGGISVFRDGSLQNFNSDNGLEAETIRCIYEDLEGNILIGSKNMGLFIYKGDGFVNYTRFQEDKPIQVNSIYEYSDGQIWLGSNVGVWISTPSEIEGKRQLSQITTANQPELLSNNIHYIIPDRDKNLWIGTWGASQRIIVRQTPTHLSIF
jgi:ligand-binding sensor domain-containing protein